MHPDLPLDQILIGDCRELLKTLPDGSVHCVVTSPPYWGLRSYGTDPQVWENGHEPCIEHTWGEPEKCPTKNGTQGSTEINKWPSLVDSMGKPQVGNTCSVCNAWRGELGLEPTPELYVEHLTQIFREVRRVLRDDGTLWLNLGDSYAGSIANGGQSDFSTSGLKRDGRSEESRIRTLTKNAKELNRPQPTNKKLHGLKPKDLVGIPWMVAFALRADGWYLRSDIIWAKPNPMPESVTDRPTKSHEYIFLLSKSQKYYYDADAIAEPSNGWNGSKFDDERDLLIRPNTGRGPRNIKGNMSERGVTRTTEGLNLKTSAEKTHETRNRRTVWTVATHPFKGAHFATFPPKLIEPCILAGCPVGGVVLDPFIGSGTTASVCISLKRHYIGFDLNPAYVEGIAQDRADNTPPPLFVL